MCKSVNKIIIVAITCLVSLGAIGQSDSTSKKDRDFRIEIEPASFFLRGAAGSIMYNVTPDNRFSLGLYSATMDIPNWTRPAMFDNVGQDTTSVRLGFELALMGRYKFDLFKNSESNPYVGFIFGWEYFDINQGTQPEVRVSTWIGTPMVGYEFYFLKEMLYLNPQLRGVFYFAHQNNDINRTEKMGSFFLLPQVSLGLRL